MNRKLIKSLAMVLSIAVVCPKAAFAAPPVANSQNPTINEDTPTPFTLTATDPEGDPMTFAIVAQPTFGSLSGIPPNVLYTPPVNFSGVDGFSFRATDSNSEQSNVAFVNITISPVNDAPVASGQNLATIGPKNVTLVATDVEGDTLTYSITVPPAHGVLSGSGANITYTPDGGYAGDDEFRFKANDGALDSNEAVITMRVALSNNPPVATGQSRTLSEDSFSAITLNATDADGDPLGYVIVSGPSDGSVTGTGANRTYTPNPNFFGTDSFTFKATDGIADSNIATVSLTVTPVNDAPIANGQNLSANEDTPLGMTLTGSDLENDPLTVTVLTQPAHGTLTGSGSNRTYTPAADFNGVDSFTFKVNDGQLDSAPGTINITVSSVNDAPVANAQTVPESTTLERSITLTATDREGDALTWIIVTPPANGTLSGSGPNRTFTPANNYAGPDSFTFKVNDGNADSNTATVTILRVNRAPVVSAGPDRTVAMVEDTFMEGSLADEDAISATWTQLQGPVPATLENPNSPTTRVTFRQPGTYAFRLTADDGSYVSTDDVEIRVLPGPAGIAGTRDVNILRPSTNNTQVSVNFTLDAPSDVTVTIRDRRLNEVKVLLDQGLSAGAQQVLWDGTTKEGEPAASGQYVADIEVNGKRQAFRKIVVVR